ncbi:MAG: hypothetical protein WC326_11295 [Candidatus Delongbacteria bacterium]
MKRILWILLLLVASLGARAQQCDTIAYHDGYAATFTSSFPLVSGTNNFTKVAYYIDPAAAGALTFMRLQFYNNNLAPVVGHNGTLRVWVHGDNAGEPGSVVAGPVDFNAAPFAAVYGTWDQVNLAGLGYSFTGGVPFHVVWEFIPSTAGHKLAVVGVTGTGAAFGNQMFNQGAVPPAWGWWFTGRGDLIQQVGLCYTVTPPGNLELADLDVDMGRVEVGQSLTETFTATNTGGMNTTVTGISVTNPALYSATIAGLPVVLAPGQSVDFSLSFQPGANVIFRDTTSVDISWTSNAVAHSSQFFAIAGSSEGTLTNDWSGAPEELDWFISADGDTSYAGAYWQLFSGGLNRSFPLAGHRYTAEGDTASSELYTLLENPLGDDLTLRYAYTQNYPDDTVQHALLVYGVEGGNLNYLYGFDVSTYTQGAPVWAHLTAQLDSLPDSVAVSFYYGGSYADDWFIDDVELIRSCTPIQISILQQGGNVVVGWEPFAGETVRILRSADAYDFSGASVVASESSSVGDVTLPATGSQWFYRAVRDCVPVVEAPASALRRLDGHPDGIRSRRLEELLPARHSADRELRILPAERTQRQLPVRGR